MCLYQAESKLAPSFSMVIVSELSQFRLCDVSVKLGVSFNFHLKL
jgi:hypothetical protein